MLTVKQEQMNPEIITSHQEILSDREREQSTELLVKKKK